MRFIPAHAGLIISTGRISVKCAVHPRTCGANVYHYTDADIALRFIPAHAGLMGVYEIPDMDYFGSSPHMRG